MDAGNDVLQDDDISQCCPFHWLYWINGSFVIRTDSLQMFLRVGKVSGKRNISNEPDENVCFWLSWSWSWICSFAGLGPVAGDSMNLIFMFFCRNQTLTRCYQLSSRSVEKKFALPINCGHVVISQHQAAARFTTVTVKLITFSFERKTPKNLNLRRRCL